MNNTISDFLKWMLSRQISETKWKMIFWMLWWGENGFVSLCYGKTYLKISYFRIGLNGPEPQYMNFDVYVKQYLRGHMACDVDSPKKREDSEPGNTETKTLLGKSVIF